MSLVDLTDIYEIRPNKDILSLDDKQKQALFDSATVVTNEGKKGLIITFDLSSSYRRTNNRLYTSRGQKAGLPTWTTPYAKPILRYHDKSLDPIGRIISVEWVSNDREAMPFFSSMQDFIEFKRIADRGDPQKIYKAMLKRNLLTDEAWPGLGRLVAKARISDNDAIEKFLDGRYMTFSAGSNTDKYCCGICGSDWAAGDICEHPPGSISEDGEPAIFITGKFNGDEASVVTMPGNSLSQIRSMEFDDSIDTSAVDNNLLMINRTDIQFTDASVDTGDIMAVATITDLNKTIDALKLMDARDLARAIWNNSLTKEQNDALGANSHFETTWLIRIHDALHREYDWELRYSGDNIEIPEAVFSFHGDLHDLSGSSGFRDSIVNGPLDGFDKNGKVSTEYESKLKNSNDSIEGLLVIKTPTPVEAITKLLADAEVVKLLKTALNEVPDESSSSLLKDENNEAKDEEESKDKDEKEVKKEDEIILEDIAMDWYLLNAGLNLELGDAKLSADEYAELDDSFFCGPGRLFPLADSSHVEAAVRLLDKAKLEEASKTYVQAAIDEKIKAFAVVDCADGCACKSLKDRLADLQKDYEVSLKIATQLKDEINTLKETQPALDTSDKTVENIDSKKMVLNVVDIKKVENVSASSSSALADTMKVLGEYEKKIVLTYNELRDKKGTNVANQFLNRKIARGHLPRTFDITPHIQENE